MADSRSITNRMIRAAKLDVGLYEEVETDTTASWQAFTVVLIISLAAGIGGVIYGLISGNASISILWWFLSGLLSIVIVWLLSALVTYLVGTTLFKARKTGADYSQLLRTIGFAFAPGILMFFTFIPFLGGLLYLVAVVWMIVTVVIAVRQALDFSTWRAISTCIVSLIPFILLYSLFTWLLLS